MQCVFLRMLTFIDCPLDEVTFTQETLISNPDFLKWPYTPNGELIKENREVVTIADHIVIEVPCGCRRTMRKHGEPD